MKKTILKTLTAASLLTVLSPVVVNAATLSADKENEEMKVGEEVYVTVNMDNPIQILQFDLNYDKNKYEYDSTGLETDLKAAGSNLINNNDTVRVSAFATEGESTKKVTLRFKAINSGESIPFSIDTSKTVELGENNNETINNTKIEVKKIVGNTIIEEENGDSEYLDAQGNKIKRLPQTNAKKSLGTFENLENGKVIVPYALSNTDNRIYLSDIKDEFGADIKTTDITEQNPVKTGDEFTVSNGTKYTVVIYGDVNCDGAVTTADALTTYRKADKNGKALDEIQLRAADVENTKSTVDANIEDAKAIQSSILQARTPKTGTILNEYPSVETYDLTLVPSNIKKYTCKKETIATLSFNSNAVSIEDDLFAFEITNKPAGSDAVIKYEKDDNGDFAIKLYTTVAGNYEITPNIKQGIQAQGQGQNPFTITIDENRAITDIKLVDENGKEITTPLTVKGKEVVQPKLKFYHQNYDINGQAVGAPIELTNVNATNIEIIDREKIEGLQEVNLHDNTADGGKPIYAEGQTTTSSTTPIDSLYIKADTIYEATTKKVVITVNNQKTYGEGTQNYSKTIEVKLSPAVEKLFINNIDLSKTSKMNLDLYTTMPNAIPTGVELYDDGDYVYTMLPIRINDSSKVKLGDVRYNLTGDFDEGKKGEIVINKNKNATGHAISFIYGFNKTGNTFTEVGNSKNEIEYIGIAIEAEEHIDELLKGLTITYDELSADGTRVNRVTKNIEVHIDPATTRDLIDGSETDDTKLPVEPKDDMGVSTFKTTKTPDDLNTPDSNVVTTPDADAPTTPDADAPTIPDADVPTIPDDNEIEEQLNTTPSVSE